MQLNTLAWTLLLTVAGSASAGAQSGAQVPSAASIHANYAKLPLRFELNQGQIDPRVRFVSRAPGYTAFLTSDGMVLSLRAQRVATSLATSESVPPSPSKRSTLQFRLLGAAKNPSVVGEIPQLGRVNYFVGNNPAKWQTNVPTYGRVRYKNVYPGIDLLYYGNQRQLEYDFAVAPGADPSRIQFEVRGAKQIQIGSDGSLVLTTGNGDIHFEAPKVYQELNGQRLEVGGGYVVTDPTHVGFQVAPYDANVPLVIDPVLVYSTYLGGSGNDQPNGIAIDTAGNVYVAGSTDSTDFPLVNSVPPPGGNPHVFVSKLDATGSNLIYTDYLGGNSQDYGYALALDTANNVYLTGSTASSDFPMVNPFQGTYPGSFNAFLTKISPDGSSLLYSTFFGGNGSDTPSGLAVDAAGDMIIAGTTSSTNLPVANAYQSTASANLGGSFGDYGFLTKFSPDGSTLVYSTYFGGNSNVSFYCGQILPCWPQPLSSIVGMALDNSGNAYVTGNTNTNNFPVTGGVYQGTDTIAQNGSVGFVSKFTSVGSLQYSTYFYEGSGQLTDIAAIAVDGSGSAYITGVAFSDGTFPVTTTSICDPGVSFYGCDFGFVTKFDTAGAALLYSTFLGLNNNAIPQAIVLDGNKDAYILALTGSGSFGLVNAIEQFSSGNDVLLAEIDAAASTQLFTTFLGGSGEDEPASAGMALDASGNLYVAGMTNSSDFPMTQATFQSVFAGNSDAFILKIGPASAPAVSFSPASLQYDSQAVSTSSQPQTVLLRNMGSSPLSISSITASSGFVETDSCGSSVLAARTCTFSVAFSPIVPGANSGTIVIQDDAAGSPHSISLSGTGLGAFVALAPSSLVFSSIPVGISSVAQTITLTNSGNMTLSISSLQIAGDYSQTNNCPSTLSAGSSCAINVTFTPTASGSRSGTVTIRDSLPGSPQTVALAGTGVALAAVVSVTPASLAFPSVSVGTSAAAQTTTLTNSGNAALAVSSIQIAGDYGQTNNCPASLPAGSTCSMTVTFTPKATGSRSGTLTISDSVVGSPQIVGLSGAGLDFSLSTSASSATVTAGTAATYSLTVAPLGGTFASAVKLSCSGAPAKTTCSLSKSSVIPGSSPSVVTLTISTTATSAGLEPLRPTQGQLIYALWMPLQGLGFFGMILAGSKRTRRSRKRLSVVIALALLVGAMLLMSACAGGTGIAPQTVPGTTPGTYTITVSGISGALQHSVPVTLTVQ
jgi:hypothetical protein